MTPSDSLSTGPWRPLCTSHPPFEVPRPPSLGCTEGWPLTMCRDFGSSWQILTSEGRRPEGPSWLISRPLASEGGGARVCMYWAVTSHVLLAGVAYQC